MNKEWMEYYKTLESIRKSGQCNMFGASTVLMEYYPKLTKNKAREILGNWMHNYEAITLAIENENK